MSFSMLEKFLCSYQVYPDYRKNLFWPQVAYGAWVSILIEYHYGHHQGGECPTHLALRMRSGGPQSFLILSSCRYAYCPWHYSSSAVTVHLDVWWGKKAEREVYCLFALSLLASSMQLLSQRRNNCQGTLSHSPSWYETRGIYPASHETTHKRDGSLLPLWWQNRESLTHCKRNRIFIYAQFLLAAVVTYDSNKKGR